MGSPDRQELCVGALWCLRTVRLPHGTEGQIRAWLEADPRPNVAVRVMKAPWQTPEGQVWFRLATGESLQLGEEAFRERYQLVPSGSYLPEQVHPERPPASHEEFLERKLAGW